MQLGFHHGFLKSALDIAPKEKRQNNTRSYHTCMKFELDKTIPARGKGNMKRKSSNIEAGKVSS